MQYSYITTLVIFSFSLQFLSPTTLSMQEHNLNVQDLQTPNMPSFQGISGQFFQSASTYINYAVPVNSQITRTPQNKAQAAKMQAIVRKIKSPSGHVARIGNSMARSGIQESALMDQTANNETVLREYAVAIMREMMKTDISYHRDLLYGDPGYLKRQQTGDRLIGGGLCGPGSITIQQATQDSHRSGSGRTGGYGYTRSGSTGQGRAFRPTAAAPVPQTEQLTQRDVLKGVDYIFQVVFKESYSLETQFFAVSLFHRCLSRLQIRKSELKLLSGVCVFIATKHEENYGEALGASAVCAYFGGAFSVQQLLRAELRLLDALNWRLGVSATNPRAYLRTLFRDLGLGLHLCVLSSFLAELTLLDQKFLKYTAFELALASIELAVISAAVQPLGVDNGKSVLQKLFLATASANSQSSKCREELNAFWGDIGKNGSVIQVYKKYQTESYFCVSKRSNIQGSLDEMVEKQLGKI